MKKQLTLSPRLALLARFAGQCGILADVGTDHALLPVWMCLQGFCQEAFACDIRSGPLVRAAKTVQVWGMESRVQLILSDGLKSVPREYDTLVVAGMGGELIARILSESPPAASVRLILQPMSGEEVLREYLYRSGHRIEQEQAVCEGDKSYIVFLACAGTSDPWVPEDCFLSPAFIPDRAGRYYIDRLIAAHRKRKNGLVVARTSRMEELEWEERLLAFLEQKRNLCQEDN